MANGAATARPAENVLKKWELAFGAKNHATSRQLLLDLHVVRLLSLARGAGLNTPPAYSCTTTVRHAVPLSSSLKRWITTLLVAATSFQPAGTLLEQPPGPSLTCEDFVVMGIKGLTKLLGDNAPRAIKQQETKAFFGRKVAIDASMCIYQLLVAVRTGVDNLTNDEGMVTSHLSGLFYRSIRLIELGIKPIYVFDGKPPPMKAGELAKRAEAKKAAEEAAKKAEEEGNLEMAEKFSRRVNRITPEMMDACKRLVRAMGIPVVESPCEAEAQCAELVKHGLAYATASEDMDSLTFGTNRLVRQLWSGVSSSAQKKGQKPTEFTLDVALEDLELDMDKFVDLCILCGCDYVDGIKGVGVVKALSLIRQYGDLEEIVKELRFSTKYEVPDPYPVERLREMFFKPEITPAKDVTLKWGKPDEPALKKLMVEENQFDETKIENGIKRLLAARKTSNQVRVDSFFKPKAAPNADTLAAKRKAAALAAKTKGKKRGLGVSKGKVLKKAKVGKK